MYSITIADENVFTVENRKPVELSNVKVYAGSPWSTARKGSIRNLEIDIMIPTDESSLGSCVRAGKTHFQYSVFGMTSLRLYLCVKCSLHQFGLID